MTRPFLALVLLAALSAHPTVARAQSTDERAIVATVHKLFDAMRTRDTAAMRALFAPNARLFGMRTRQNGEVVLQSLTADEFASFVARDTRAPWIERAFNPVVHVRGTLATVWAEYDFHFGTQPSHCGVDAVQLLKTPERGWQIVSIADTFEQQGCPTRPAPSP
jgi:ketosteroid isomerase-like protein